MKLSNFERQQFSKQVKAAREQKDKSISLRQKIENFPGRVVSVNTAEQRVRYQNKSLEDACLRPSESRKGDKA